MSTQKVKRQLAGIPAGGQFTHGTKAEPGLILETAFNESGAVPASGMPVLGAAAAGYRDWVGGDGHLVKQVRFNGAKPDDAPDGTAAVILYTKGGTTEAFYRNGVLHDGSGHFPSRRYTTVKGKTVTTRGYRDRHRSMTDQDSPDGQPAMVVAHEVGEPNEWEPADGRIETHWMTAGHRQDPAPGVPAVTVEMLDGGLRHRHYPLGRMSDLPDGTPAEQIWNASGQLVAQARYYDGFLFDGDDGEPAVRRWRDDGTLSQECRYVAGKLRPGAEGEPAVVEYEADGVTPVVKQDPWRDPWQPERRKRAREWPYARTAPYQRGPAGTVR